MKEQVYYINALDIKKWMEENNRTKPPSTHTDNKEEAKLGRSWWSIKTKLIKPYKELKTEEEREEYKSQHPELEDVITIIEEIDTKRALMVPGVECILTYKDVPNNRFTLAGQSYPEP